MEFVLIGNIQSAQGIRGEVFVQIFAGEAYWEDLWQTLHLGERDSQTPSKEIKILKKRPHQKQKKIGYALTLEGVNDRNRSEELVGMGVYVPSTFLVSDEDEEIYLREVLGFEVEDVNRGSVGKVVGFAGTSMQDLLVIEDGQGRQFEVPFVEPIHKETLKEDKKLIMDIPQGLVAGEEL